MLEEMQLDHAVRNSIAFTKLPLGCNILKEEEQKGEKIFFEKKFSLDFFLTFWLSYSTYSIIAGSGT